MPLTKNEISQLVSSPSVGAVAYQAHLLVQLLDRISDEEFPREACIIREVLLCYAERGRDELFKLYKVDSKKSLETKGGDAEAKRVRLLGELIRELYSYIRYLLASSPRQSPPALQDALNQLVEVYFPKEAGTSVCVVRPQWKYNLEYVPLTSKIRKVVALSVIDPDGKLGISSSEEIIPPWWQQRRERRKDKKVVGKEPPKQLAILSFAGLDTSDALCFPLLAHELGHFIDFSETPPYYLSKAIRESSQIRTDEVEEVIKRVTKKIPRPEETAYETKKLVDQASICLREILADLLAIRMMGFSFFVAQAEFLKTLAPWSQPRILSYGHPAGYPGIKFRLWAILRHLLTFHPHNPEVFFEERRNEETDAKSLIEYLNEWKGILEPDHSEPPKGGDQDERIVRLQTELSRTTEKAVKNSLEGITRIAQKIIPDDSCAKLSPLFFERILMLSKDLPPSCPNEDSRSFSEIMSAAWAYQILYGEERELKKDSDDKKYKEYEKTCNLVLKAIELIPAAQAINLATETAEPGTSADDGKWLEARGVLSKEHIRKRVRLPITNDSHLSVLPLNLKAIQDASLDVHLGNWFSYARRTKLDSVKLPDEKEKLAMIGREEVFIPSEKDFLLHPGDLVLGVTQEFFGLPNDVMAFVEGKSGLGRLGLFVATATQVAPGYHGVIVLELANAGTVPLKLSPGMEIAQLVFQVMTESMPSYHGEYQCQIKP
jgi:deoxycytidine triphosphate deaminase